MLSDGDPSLASEPFRLRWDVFLSFRGEDTRHGITKNLYYSLQSHGIRVFMDDDGLGRGEEISQSLIQAIEDSAASIVIISPDYASSRWCLEELARICELRRLILPVFYRVDPSDVRHQRRSFEVAFGKHKDRFVGEEEKILRWRKALRKVADTAGWVFNGETESDEKGLIRVLVKEVLKQLSNTPINVARHAVGLDSRVEELMRLLNVRSNSVEVLGLHGMGGIGKTTLAKALYNKLLGHEFECRSFISNVRECSAKVDGLLSLQSKLIDDLQTKLDGNCSYRIVQPANSVNANKQAIRRIIGEKKVLVVLDDVGDISQLNALSAEIAYYSGGSRIIITTRDKELLHENYVNQIYEVRELYPEEALELFSYHALSREKPTDEFLNLSKQIVSLTGRLPLALEVFGSFLFDKRTLTEWEDSLKKLRQIRPQNLQEVLKISFDGLDKEEQCIFLDIACFFVKLEMKREDAIDILRGCGFKAKIAITVLTRKSLIKISADDILWMHDQLRDMGRQIVQEENLTDPGKRSRLWDCEEIMSVLKNNKGTRDIQGIILDIRRKFVMDPDNEEDVVLCTEPFEQMVSLRLLEINNSKLEGKFKCLPAELRWLQWHRCTLKNLGSDFCPQKLAVLDLSDSKINCLWGSHSNLPAHNLMVMNLQRCCNLATIPDLSGYQALEKLVLENCGRLIRIHESVGSIRSLLHLNMRDCSSLVELPSDVSGLKSLQTLILSSCFKLKTLPEGLGSMKSLKELLLDNTAIEKLPESVYRLTKLEKLSLTGCRSLEQLPKYIGNLSSLKELYLDDCVLKELPDSAGSLVNLEILSLWRCESLTTIPDAVGNLKLLVNLLISGEAIEELPSSIGKISYLKDLSIGKCSLVNQLPDSINGLVNVVELQLDGTPITYLPNQIGDLKSLQKLTMRKCPLTLLPESIGNLLGLSNLTIFKANITELPESIGRLENLTMLRLNECERLCKLPASIGDLKSLHHLWMEKTAVTELPDTFGKLSNLMVLKMAKRPLTSLHRNNCQEDAANLSTKGKPISVVLPTSFSNLSLLRDLDAHAWRLSGKIPDDFEKLCSLEILNLGRTNFSHLPTSLRGVSHLKKLLLSDCRELESLPPLPSSLEEVNLCNCVSLERIDDLSNLRKLEELNLTNCEKVVDIPGLESLESLRRLFMSDCNACSSAVRKRFSKVCLKNMSHLSMPGSSTPDWFFQDQVIFSSPKNREIKGVILAAIVSLNHHFPDDLRDLPVVPDVQVELFKGKKNTFKSGLYLRGVPITNRDNLYLCRYPPCHPLVLSLEDGIKIQLTKQNSPTAQGVELKEGGIYFVFDDDDDYEGNEEPLKESQQSVSQRLANFFHSLEDGDQNSGGAKVGPEGAQAPPNFGRTINLVAIVVATIIFVRTIRTIKNSF
ncbi:hypothetical protein SLEP1_g32598 [Rubroshorea leprosula]|uniref:TIR domain-containing protein n=1 Tax=Rubroshorea leprosula TaxID=152421 RepID=A0AAV5KDW0_9ROSI|nr:hypothetical protein SLEP1_g32598 [Rubroshorea leprosula]